MIHLKGKEGKKKRFTTQLINWYHQHKRILPWRNTNDPYKIWLSEIILQQTRVAQGLPYYQRFVTQYPTIHALAQATEEQVLRLWQGLGYYTRARNLHTCARTIVAQFEGIFPNNYQILLSLKGIGPYTAAAIASIAFKEPSAVVDGNVYRVLARVFGISSDIASTKGKKDFYTLASSLVPHGEPDIYSQAIMEFGALQCTPQPSCATCMLQQDCNAFVTKRQSLLPVNNRKIKLKKRFFNYIVLQYGNTIYMRRREKKDIWKGLYDFYLVETDKVVKVKQLNDDLVIKLTTHQLPIAHGVQQYHHTLTHQKLLVNFTIVQVNSHFLNNAQPLLDQYKLYPFTLTATQELPKPILTHNFLKWFSEEYV